MTNLEFPVALPHPPTFPRAEVRVPPFFRVNHPYTRWMVNMIRVGASFRLATMVKERPELFQQIYQIPDMPHVMRNDSYDQTPLFDKRSVLYMNPLCLAIYLRNEKATELILRTGVNHPHQVGYATDAFRKGNSTACDIIEFTPICIAIRREFFEAVAILSQSVPDYGDVGYTRFDPRAKLEFRYESKDCRKVFRYKDTLHYVTETLQKRPNFAMSRLMDVMVNYCPNFFDPDLLDDDGGQHISLFRRLARLAYYDDQDGRICYQLISSLDTLLKTGCFAVLSPEPTSFDSLESRLGSQNVAVIDQDACLALLLALYNRLHFKVQNGPLDYLGDVINKTLVSTGWRSLFLSLPVENLQDIFCAFPEHISISCDSLVIVKKHIAVILDLEKDKDRRMIGETKWQRTVRHVQRSVPRTAGYPTEPQFNENLLQCRRTTSTGSATSCYSSTDYTGKPVNNLYKYRHGTGNAGTAMSGSTIDATSSCEIDLQSSASGYTSDKKDVNQNRSANCTPVHLDKYTTKSSKSLSGAASAASSDLTLDYRTDHVSVSACYPRPQSRTTLSKTQGLIEPGISKSRHIQTDYMNEDNKSKSGKSTSTKASSTQCTEKAGRLWKHSQIRTPVLGLTCISPEKSSEHSSGIEISEQKSHEIIASSPSAQTKNTQDNTDLISFDKGVSSKSDIIEFVDVVTETDAGANATSDFSLAASEKEHSTISSDTSAYGRLLDEQFSFVDELADLEEIEDAILRQLSNQFVDTPNTGPDLGKKLSKKQNALMPANSSRIT